MYNMRSIFVYFGKIYRCTFTQLFFISSFTLFLYQNMDLLELTIGSTHRFELYIQHRMCEFVPK